jgi:hypothetical protein
VTSYLPSQKPWPMVTSVCGPSFDLRPGSASGLPMMNTPGGIQTHSSGVRVWVFVPGDFAALGAETILLDGHGPCPLAPVARLSERLLALSAGFSRLAVLVRADVAPSGSVGGKPAGSKTDVTELLSSRELATFGDATLESASRLGCFQSLGKMNSKSKATRSARTKNRRTEITRRISGQQGIGVRFAAFPCGGTSLKRREVG